MDKSFDRSLRKSTKAPRSPSKRSPTGKGKSGGKYHQLANEDTMRTTIGGGDEMDFSMMGGAGLGEEGP
jgi:hypothetical protein